MHRQRFTRHAVVLALVLQTAIAHAQPDYVYRTEIPGLQATPAATATSASTPAATPSPVGIVSQSGAGAWADGTIATSCNGYLNPTGNYAYSGYTGNGLYWIKPAAAGSAFEVTCDMTSDGGGWTLIGTFNGTTDTSLTATQRNSIAYTQAKISLNGTATSKVITCHTAATTGFAADNAGGTNCTVTSGDGNLYAVRVDQAGFSTGGNYGLYTDNNGSLASLGACDWAANSTYVWGRIYNGSSGCLNYGNGDLFSSSNGWGANLDWLLVR